MEPRDPRDDGREVWVRAAADRGPPHHHADAHGSGGLRLLAPKRRRVAYGRHSRVPAPDPVSPGPRSSPDAPHPRARQRPRARQVWGGPCRRETAGATTGGGGTSAGIGGGARRGTGAEAEAGASAGVGAGATTPGESGAGGGGTAGGASRARGTTGGGGTVGDGMKRPTRGAETRIATPTTRERRQREGGLNPTRLRGQSRSAKSTKPGTTLS